MSVAGHIAVDLERGEVRLGARRIVLVAAAAPHTYYLDNDAGPLLRVLCFEERTLLLLGAKRSEIAQRIAEAALVTAGDSSEALRFAVSLALAGGAEQAPSFSECAAVAARLEGWSPQRVDEAPALVVDRMSRAESPSLAVDEWKRIVFTVPEPDIEELMDGMVENLSQRSIPPTAVDSADPESRQTPIADAVPPSFWSRSPRVVEGMAMPSPMPFETGDVRTPLDVARSGAERTGVASEAAHAAINAQSASERLGSAEASEARALRDEASAQSEMPGGTKRPALSKSFAVETRTNLHAASLRPVIAEATKPAFEPARAIRASAKLHTRVEVTQLKAVQALAPESSSTLAAKRPATRRTSPIAESLPVGESRPFAMVGAELERPAPGASTPVEAQASSRYDLTDELAAKLEAECDLRGIESVSTRPVPLLGDTSLQYVQRIEHSLETGFVSSRIAGLEGELQQRSGRLSHRVYIEGVLFGESARNDLGTLQTAAQTGEELSFAADITSALDLQKVVINSFRAEEGAGRPDQIHYRLELTESPPLPPPAEVSGFGGLDDFGLGDLGIDTSMLGDLEALAGDVAGAVDQAMGAIDALGALADLASSGGLDFGGMLDPLNQAVDNMRGIASNFQGATRSLGGLFSS